MREIDHYFMDKPEPLRGSLLALRELVLHCDNDISEAWQYKMPFYLYQGKRFCYLWQDKKTLQPYIGIVDGKMVEHPGLILDKRARMKILMLDASKGLPVKNIKSLLKKTLALYK